MTAFLSKNNIEDFWELVKYEYQELNKLNEDA